MVKARHKAIGGRICVYPPYIETRRSNRRQNLIRSDIIDSDDSGIVKVRRGTRGAIMRVQNHESNELDIPVKNLRSRRRSYGQYEDPITTEEEDNTLPDTKVSNTRRVKKRSNKISEIRTKEMKGVICDHNNGELQIRRSSRPRKPVILDFEYDPSPTRRSTRQKKPPAIFQEINSEDEKEYNVRRSGRQRKFVYDKLSQKDILRTQENGYEEDDRRKRKHSNSDSQDDNEGDDQDFRDMYSRVKRPRRKVKRDMYGIPLQDSEDASTDDDEGSSTEESTSESDECENSSNEEQEEIDDNNNRSRPKRKVTQLRSAYHLRENKPRTKIYEAPPIESRTRKIRNQSLFTGSRESPPGSPVRRNKKRHKMYRSPAHRRKNFRRHAVSYGSSSSTSSSSSSSSDEEKFEKRRAKSMAKARNRCMPMNLSRVDLSSGIMKDRARVGASLADIDPMSLDKSVKFDSVGGLGKHIRSLKEMVVFPLLYPEVFERFKISPPRGVLFYGPPGTGKTLVARALANECSSDDRRVSFFMRKGADCLSKWVGESERQLRLLFDQAYQMRPSIIFFDEIDGLAPVRSSRQDQIHSSIVSTLLALMDGLDNRGEVVVIGATNRIDSIDPALRRPGRFDREFLFPLPSASARKQIINIHTKDWNPKLSESFVEALSEKSVGFCGADLKALCTEAALQALRRRYPQIYTSTEKLQLDVTTIQISAKDFFAAMNVIVPTSQRSVTSPAKAFSPSIAPLFKAIFTKALEKIHDIFPTARSKLSLIGESVKNLHQKHNMNEEDMEDFFSDDEETISIHHDSCRKRRNSTDGVHSENIDFQSYAIHHPSTYRPRILLSGKNGQGQTTHLAPAILHYLEHLPVHVLDLPTLYAASAKTPEESCAQVFREARRACPSVIYLPHVNEWWDILSDTLRATLLMLVQDLDPSASLLLLATSEEPAKNLDTTLQELFSQNKGEVLAMTNPCAELRKRFFSDLILNQTNKRPPGRKQAAKRILEILPRAPPPEPKKLTDAEIRSLREQEENTLRELRIFLRDVLNKLGRDRKFTIFAKPVDVEEVVDYYDIISHPMDLSTMMTKIDCREYNSVRQFLTDIDLICSNALEYNPSRAPTDRAIRHRACALKDTAAAIVKTELDPEFEKLCAEIVQSRQRRGENESTAPEFYHTLPSRRTSMHSSNIPPSSSGSRQSRRVRGMEVEVPVDVEAVERSVRIERSMTNTQGKQKEHQSDKNETPIQKGRDHSRGSSSVKKQSRNSVKRGSSAKSKPRKKEVWSYKKRKRRPFRFFSSRPKSRSGNISDVEVLDDGDYSDEQDAQTPDSRSKIDDVAHASLKSDHRSSMKKLSTPERHLSPSRSRSPRRQVSPARSNVPCKSEGSKHTTPIADSKAALSSIAPSIQTHLGDSGVGSSLDSNGDSRDSTDHAKAVSDKMKTPEKTAEFMDNRQSRRAGSCSPPPVIHVTRSKDKTKHQQMAIDILEESIPPLVIDNDKLHNLLEYVVRKTHDYTVEDLEKLYSLLSQCIFRHRMEHDKAALVTDMEQKIHVFTSH